jgi:hypothetical protein
LRERETAGGAASPPKSPTGSGSTREGDRIMSSEKLERDVRDLGIDDTNLDEELTKQAGLFFYVAEKAVLSEQKYKDYKAQIDRLEATLSGQAREEIKKRGDKPTEKMVSDWVILNESFKKAQAYLNQLFTEKEVMRALRDSWYMRKDMIVQIAVKQRSELESLAHSAIKARDEDLAV